MSKLSSSTDRARLAQQVLAIAATRPRFHSNPQGKAVLLASSLTEEETEALVMLSNFPNWPAK